MLGSHHTFQRASCRPNRDGVIWPPAVAVILESPITTLDDQQRSHPSHAAGQQVFCTFL